MLNLLHLFDSRVTAWVQSWPLWLLQPMTAITNVGQPLTIILFTSVLLIWSLGQRDTRMTVASGIVLATVIISAVLKLVLRRNRPETEYAANMMYQTFSFPSGHSAAATVGFGFLAYIAMMSVLQPWNIVLGLAATIFGALVCLSRIYLGAHFPSDVVGGVLLGLIGLLNIILVVNPLS